MYRVLIVEDIPLHLTQLTKLILEGLPRSDIVAATNVREARQHIRAARESGRFFFAAIVDVMLPPQKGYSPKADHTIETDLWNHPGQTLIIRVTAFDDEDVRKHFEKARSRTQPRVLPISKLESGYTQRILNELRRDRIFRQIDDLFGIPSGHLAGRESATFALAGLIQDIEMFWPTLDEEDRAPIREYFNIQEKDGSVTVILGGRGSSKEIAST